MKLKYMVNWRFILKTAIRDSRKNLGKLFMFLSSIILGIMALVAINSFNYNLVKDIDGQTKTILGADIQVEGKKPIPAHLVEVLDSVPGERASEMEFFSMAFMPKSEETQFCRIKAIEGNFPFYGELKTKPLNHGNTFREQAFTVLVDDALMFEHDLKIGDEIRLGNQVFTIGARLMNSFGSVSLGASFAPTIYMNQKYISTTGLIQPGSIVEYKYFIKTPADFDREAWDNSRSRMAPFRAEDFRVTTIEDQRRNLNRAFSFLNTFLNLVALVALILGCIGVASSVFIYVKSKIPSIAILRCLGVKPTSAFLVYFVQIILLGFIAVLIGATLGSFTQVALPVLLKDVLPYEVKLSISWPAIFQGITIGMIVTSLFALLPLLSVRNISPLRTLRASFEESSSRDPWKLITYFLIVASFVGFLFSLTKDVRSSMLFMGGLLAAFLLLYLVASLVVLAVKKFFPSTWSFVLRQGIANLFRPNNQTKTLIVSVGLGTAILTLLYIIQGLILSNVESMDAGNQPNMVLYGIETEQKEDIANITKEAGMPVTQQVPIVTMRLAGWKGKTKDAWLKDTTRRAERWVIRREARVTYRSYLEDDEPLVAGKFTGKVNPGDSILISLDQGWAESLDVTIGDEIVWNVQGALITTYVGSFREIEFRSMRTRFFILFPEGVLEAAPQFHVLVTKSPNNKTMASYRREVVKKYPNVSVVDLGSILTTLNEIISKISYVIKFMAGFSILTGLIVLISSLLLSKFQRIKEAVLLRTIGAKTKQIIQINAIEYLILGVMSAFTGILIAIVGSYFIASSELDLQFQIQWLPLFVIFFAIVGLTIAIGLLNTREVIQKSPLEVLRREVG